MNRSRIYARPHDLTYWETEVGSLIAIETEQKREWTNWSRPGHDKGSGRGTDYKQQPTRTQLIKQPALK